MKRDTTWERGGGRGDSTSLKYFALSWIFCTQNLSLSSSHSLESHVLVKVETSFV